MAQKQNRWLLGSAIALLIWFLQSPGTWAQIPGLDFSLEEVTVTPTVPTIQLGNLAIAPVFLDGRPIASLATEIDFTENLPSTTQVSTAAFRAQQISRRLQGVLARMLTYSRTDLTEVGDREIQQEALKGEIVVVSQRIEAEEIRYDLKLTFPQEATPEPIVTLTPTDALYTRQSIDELARQWQRTIVNELLTAWTRRQPTVLLQQAGWASVGLVIIGLISWGGWLVQRRLRRRRQPALNKAEPIAPPGDPVIEDPDSPLALLTVQVRRFNRQLERNLNLFACRLLFWMQVLLWVLSIGAIARLFYFSRPFANWLLGVSPREWFVSWGQTGIIGKPLVLLFLFFVLSIGDRVTNLMIERVARAWLMSQVEQHEPSARLPLRVPTLVSAAKGVTTFIIYGTFGLLVLNQFRAISTPVTALLGIITFGISLGAQNVIKDVINGILILVEDQYAVGDVIVLPGEVAGLVEYVNLRITQLRSLDGELITVPNGSISTVRNITSHWSQAQCLITISPHADLDRALAVMLEVAQNLYQEENWQAIVLDQPVLLGVEQLDHHGIQILLLLKAKPFKHWDVVREYRRRLHYAFAQAGIEFGAPRQEVIIRELPRTMRDRPISFGD